MTNSPGNRRILPLASALVFTGGLLALFLGRFTPARTALTRLAEPLAAALLVLLASIALGWLALVLSARAFRRFGGLAGDAVAPSDPLAALLVGLPLYGTLIGAIAWTRTGVPLATIAVTLLLGVGGLLVARRFQFTWPQLGPGGVVLLLPPVLLALLLATTPVVSPDELVYKLAVPRAYLLHGGMVDLPLNSHSYLTMAQGLACFGALVLSGGIAAKLVHFVLYLGALGAIRRLGDRLEPGSGAFAAAIFAWTPALAIISGWCWNEWVVFGLLTLSWDAWERFKDERSADTAALTMLALGGAVAIKYTALPWLCGFAIVVLLEPGLRSKRPASWFKLGATSVVILAISGALFYLRNLIWTGSPVAPFLLPHAPAVAHFGGSGGASGIAHLLHGDDIVNHGILDDALGVVLPVCVLLSPFALRGRRRRWPFFILGAVQFVLFAVLAPMSRLIVVSLLPLGVLGAGVVADAARASGRMVRGVLAATLAIVLAAQLLLVVYVFVTGYDFMAYVAGNEDLAANLTRTRAFAGAYDWIDRNTAADSVVLLIGENRTYHLSRRSLSAGTLDGPRLAAWLGRFSCEAELAAELSRLGVTHVLLHPAWVAPGVPLPKELDAVEASHVVEFPAPTWSTVNQFLEHRCRSGYRDNQYLVFECGPKPGS